jgi:hypothetical protein
MGSKKILLGKYPSYQGKTKIAKVNFRMNFFRELEQRMVVLHLVEKI